MFSQPTRKRFGQHWLTDEKVLHAMLEAAAVTRQDCALEIGPGTGALTRWLLPLAKAVVAVEIDRDLVRKLNNQFAKHNNFRLVPSDILELDIAAVSRDKNFDYGVSKGTACKGSPWPQSLWGADGAGAVPGRL